MNVIQVRTNGKIAIGIGILLTLLYLYFLIPLPSRRIGVYRPKVKVRHHLSYYLDQITKNDTLFKEVTDQEFLHVGSKEALRRYFRPNKSPQKGVAVSFQPEPRNFNIDEDVIVYLHIQKVGGTVFNGHLINDLDKGFDCDCKKNVITNPCYCKNKQGRIWLFSWFTVGWPCELHADWTMLHECVEKAMDELEGPRKRRYFYIALLRDPLSRYLSEWRHQNLGNHWEASKLRCNYKRVPLFDVRPCFMTETWAGCTLDEFMECPENLATNRQTRMMANLTKSDCYRRNGMKADMRAIIQLDSARENLQRISFFGLTERQTETQHMFEKTFGLKFKVDFQHLNDKEEEEMISEDEFVNVVKFIELDVQFYLFAEKLFQQRLDKLH